MIENRSALAASGRHDVALDCIEAGLDRVRPERIVDDAMAVDGAVLTVDGSTYDLGAFEEVVVVGGGNAAGHLAASVEGVLGERIQTGVVVTDVPCETARIEQIRGAHPIPDEAAVAGARQVLERVQAANGDTLVLAVLSGGASALLPAPADPVSLADLQTVTDQLLQGGAAIEELNAVRKHLSRLKGGQLARAAAPATVVGLVVSDVVGNRLDVIASGPLSPDTSTFEEAQTALEAYDIGVPDGVRERLAAGAAGDIPETPHPGDDAFDTVSVHVIADGLAALEAAADTAADHGYEPLVLGDRIRGEATEAATVHVGIGESIAATGTPTEPPAVVLSGGETTVTVQGDGTGGPNQEFALSSAIELAQESICVASVDTDGIDGPTDAAGAIVTAADGRPAATARAALQSNNASQFLARTDSLIRTGPTGTNVNDLRVLVVGP